jgi:hypothetical protein
MQNMSMFSHKTLDLAIDMHRFLVLELLKGYLGGEHLVHDDAKAVYITSTAQHLRVQQLQTERHSQQQFIAFYTHACFGSCQPKYKRASDSAVNDCLSYPSLMKDTKKPREWDMPHNRTHLRGCPAGVCKAADLHASLTLQLLGKTEIPNLDLHKQYMTACGDH